MALLCVGDAVTLLTQIIVWVKLLRRRRSAVVDPNHSLGQAVVKLLRRRRSTVVDPNHSLVQAVASY